VKLFYSLMVRSVVVCNECSSISVVHRLNRKNHMMDAMMCERVIIISSMMVTRDAERSKTGSLFTWFLSISIFFADVISERGFALWLQTHPGQTLIWLEYRMWHRHNR